MEQSIKEELVSLFEAERRVRRVHDQLVARGQGADLGKLLAALSKAVAEAKGCEPDEAVVRLVCLARVLGEFDGPEIADCLLQILDSEHPDARFEAGLQLQSVAVDDFEDVAAAVGRAVGRLATDSPALEELPFLLAELDDPRAVPLIRSFLELDASNAVGAALQVVVETGDLAALPFIEALVDDKRSYLLDEADGDGRSEVTLGELAGEAVQLLRAEPEPEQAD